MANSYELIQRKKQDINLTKIVSILNKINKKSFNNLLKIEFFMPDAQDDYASITIKSKENLSDDYCVCFWLNKSPFTLYEGESDVPKEINTESLELSHPHGSMFIEWLSFHLFYLVANHIKDGLIVGEGYYNDKGYLIEDEYKVRTLKWWKDNLYKHGRLRPERKYVGKELFDFCKKNY